MHVTLVDPVTHQHRQTHKTRRDALHTEGHQSMSRVVAVHTPSTQYTEYPVLNDRIHARDSSDQELGINYANQERRTREVEALHCIRRPS